MSDSASGASPFPLFDHSLVDTSSACLALDTLMQRPTRGIPTTWLNVMEHACIERIAGTRPGSYRAEPAGTYLAMHRAFGANMLDQYIPDNPLSMEAHGYEGAERGATTGAKTIVRDGIVIDTPEAVVEHMERFVFPALEAALAEPFDEEQRARDIVGHENAVQRLLGPTILKTGHGTVHFPGFDYGAYGYEHYFSAWALYPEVLERGFSLQGDLSLRHNRAVARAYLDGKLPPLNRLDHDIADSRGTLVRPESLDRVYMPHFARSLEPLLKTDVRLIWHCDGNLMAMVPRLLDVGLHGFQGFQYEDGMDYERICRMKTRNGDGLIIWAGASVTRTLPHGTPTEVRDELRWLVEQGPRTGLFLGASSSIAPGVPWENLSTFLEGLAYYRQHGRG